MRVRRGTLDEIEDLRGQYRSQADCQIVHDSILPRGLADPYVVELEGHVVAYAGLWNKYFVGRLLEFYCVPSRRHAAAQMILRLRDATRAIELEVQSNIGDFRGLLESCADPIWEEKILFAEGPETELSVRGLRFRRRLGSDNGPEGDWVVEEGGRVIGAGGWLTHYNPPYADLYMEVVEDARGRGVGSFLVQELRRACTAAGLRPAARCDPDNHASRRALERGGLIRCGEILAGTLRAD